MDPWVAKPLPYLASQPFEPNKSATLLRPNAKTTSGARRSLLAQAGVAKQVISNIERGSVTASVNTLAAVAHALGLTIHDIINVGFSQLTA
jgi:DNA-binding XRE family transcriptional regulator